MLDPKLEPVVLQLIEALQPLKGTGSSFHDEDIFGPDDPIRSAVSEALKRLNVDGLGGCRLCAS